MKKPYKVLSATALAAVLATSSLVPVMAQAATTNEVSEVIVTADGVNYKMTQATYSALLDAGKAPANVQFVTSSTGKTYTIAQYSNALDSADNVDEALAELDKSATAQTIVTEEAKFDKDGNLVTTPVVEGLKVESVMAITETGVEVTVVASEEDRTETIKVTDPEGKEVEVKSTLIPAGQTKVTFDFAKAYDKLPLGTFNVAGKDFDTAAVAAVKEVKEAAQANNVIKLWSALQSTYFEGALEENIDAYETAVNKAATDNKLNTVADVNKLIADVNKAQVSDEAEAKVVKSVIDGIGGNALQVYNLLNKNFDRVNSEWITAYKDETVVLANGGPTALKNLTASNYFGESAGTTVEAIQDAIDSANAKEVAKAYDKAFKSLNSTDVADARALANKYLTANADDAVTQKEYANDSLDILDALIRVNEAKTPNALKSALTALDNLETNLVNKYNAADPDSTFEKDIDLKKVNDELLQKYITTISETPVTSKNQRSDIQAIINGVNNSTSEGLVDAVDAATDADSILKALQDLKLDNVAESNKTQYETDLTSFKSAADSADVAKSLTDLQTQVDLSNVAAVAAANTADKLLVALKNAGIANVVDANKAAYDTAAVNKEGDKYFAAVTTKDQAQKVVNAVNAYAVANKATTATEMRTALTTFAVALDNLGGVAEAPAFINLSSQAKLEVAEIVLNAKDGNFTTAYTLGQAVDAAMTAHGDFLDAVNGATDINTTKVALTDEDVYPAFVELSADAKVAKAEAVYNALVALKADGKEFTTVQQIKDIVE